jgi:hypothetical protein
MPEICATHAATQIAAGLRQVRIHELPLVVSGACRGRIVMALPQLEFCIIVARCVAVDIDALPRQHVAQLEIASDFELLKRVGGVSWTVTQHNFVTIRDVGLGFAYIGTFTALKVFQGAITLELPAMVAIGYVVFASQEGHGGIIPRAWRSLYIGALH